MQERLEHPTIDKLYAELMESQDKKGWFTTKNLTTDRVNQLFRKMVWSGDLELVNIVLRFHVLLRI